MSQLVLYLVFVMRKVLTLHLMLRLLQHSYWVILMGKILAENSKSRFLVVMIMLVVLAKCMILGQLQLLRKRMGN